MELSSLYLSVVLNGSLKEEGPIAFYALIYTTSILL